ncbi:ATP-binding protein [Streptomyces sp. SR27]|uniref:ATP-binding protein n=1 Tax=Streptomyces sp. SR27 TaxID=3076630 RepID=UPI00295BC34B|nr:ATP-binding protein [Streptomyces sp. SR27]MDV9190060.1 ATP-binding protein [Streptomyces sp. SR27]
MRAARGLVRSALHTWGMASFVPDALVAVSELASNAVLHSGGPEIEVRVCRSGPDRVRIEVTDRSRFLPLHTLPQPDAESGRGLLLVDALADRWGAVAVDGGKCVWAELSAHGQGQAPSPLARMPHAPWPTVGGASNASSSRAK